MNKKIAAFVVLCLVGISVWWIQRAESMVTQTSRDSGSEVGHSKQSSHRSPKPQALALTRGTIRSMERSLNHSLDNRRENEIMAKEDNTKGQRDWRLDWIDEGEDVEWTKRMADEVYDRADLLQMKEDIELHDLSCRETVCRMYLDFNNKLDAAAYTSAEHNPGYQYEYQLLNPPRPGAESSQGSQYNYEVLVKRERPENLPENIRPLTPESANATTTDGIED